MVILKETTLGYTPVAGSLASSESSSIMRVVVLVFLRTNLCVATTEGLTSTLKYVLDTICFTLGQQCRSPIWTQSCNKWFEFRKELLQSPYRPALPLLETKIVTIRITVITLRLSYDKSLQISHKIRGKG
jgi:hypothetical protein